MKHPYLLCSFFILSLGCSTRQNIPEGHWQSLQGRSSISMNRDTDGNLHATVYHCTAEGILCPVSYPVIEKSAYCIYIQAEGKIFLNYSNRDSTLVLSPGGKYQMILKP